MREIDKAAMGRRIRQIRLEEGLRQWELARLLGTTQSAVHKYEHGVVPEPRRLVELARIGRTSLEWILTGRHWESGSDKQERLSPELLRTAELLREIQTEERASADEALRIMREAVRALAEIRDGNRSGPSGSPVSAFRDLSEETVRLLETAWVIQRAVLRRVLRDTAVGLSTSSLVSREADSGAEEP